MSNSSDKQAIIDRLNELNNSGKLLVYRTSINDDGFVYLPILHHLEYFIYDKNSDPSLINLFDYAGLENEQEVHEDLLKNIFYLSSINEPQ